MVVEVSENKVIITGNSVVNANEVCVNKCRLYLPDSFNGLVVTAIFNGIPVPVVDNECYIPSLEEGNVVLGVYAYKEVEGEVQLMYSPKPAIFYVSQGSFCESLNDAAVPQISQYEQYCKMIADKYTAVEEGVEKAEADRQSAENARQNTFARNEEARQKMFDINERIRQAEFNGAYTNLLKDYAEEIPTEAENTATTFPANLPCKKTGVWYYEYTNEHFKVKSGFDCYIIEVEEGERFNISNYSITNAYTYIVDENWDKIISYAVPTQLMAGFYAMPENAKYLILHTPTGSPTPNITRVSEPVIFTNDARVSNSGKFIAQQKDSTDKHLIYTPNTSDGTLLDCAFVKDNRTDVYGLSFASGIYPLESGKEYIVCYNESNVPKYAYCGYICDENFRINKTIQYQTDSEDCLDFDENKRLVFTATENDKYIALNCYDFNGNLQFGESKAQGISKLVKIGNALFDGKNDITLGEIGGIDRSLVGKKWVSYGDSITWGSKIESGQKRWQDYIIKRYSISLHKNMGIGSTAIACKEGVTLPAMCTDDRLNSLIAENPDIVTILGGANDLSYDIPIGTDEDIANKNKSTFKGAYAYIVEKVLSAKPDTVIVLMGMYLCAQSYYTGVKTHTLKEYAQATKEIAERFGLPFVDLNECGFNSYNFNTTDGIFTDDGIHPNAEGVKRIAMVVSKWFDTFKGSVF